MRIRPQVLFTILSLAGAGAGCATTSIRGDLDEVERLTGRHLPAGLVDDAEPVLHAQIASMLRQPLDADAAVRIAIANNHELRATLRELGVERGRLLQASLLPNPEVEVGFRRPEEPDGSTQVELAAGYEITEALLVPIRAAAARRDLAAARYAAAGRVIALEYEVREAFYATQAAEEGLAIARRTLDALAAAREAADMLFESGNIPELDQATQLAAHEEAKATIAGLEMDRAAARERLSRLLGLHGRATRWRTAGSFDPVPDEPLPASLERTAIESSVELAETRLRLEAFGKRIGLSRAEGWIPDVSLVVSGEREEQAWHMGAGASISVPLFDRNDGNTAALEAGLAALLERYRGTAVDIRSAARDARNRLASARRRTRQYTEVIVPARERVFRQTLLQYNAMQVGIFELLAALRGRLSAELAAVGVLREYWTARAAVDALVRGRRVGAVQSERTVDIGAGEGSAGGH